MLQSHYLEISILLAFLAVLLLICRLEKRHTHVRRLVLIAVLTSLSILSRFVFAPIPFFKPMAALIILTGMNLGWDTGFLCGALTALLTNIYFGQGPWTPFQMLGLGMIGLFAGLLSLPLKKSRPALILYGACCGVFYSFFMDIWTCLWAYDTFALEGYKAALISAIPVTIFYVISNVIFLLLLAKPLSDRLGRVLVRYRI